MIGNHVDGAKLSQGFESLTRSKFTWPCWSSEKTPPFHGGNTGSNPVRVILIECWRFSSAGRASAYKQRVSGSIPLTSIMNWFRGVG